MTNFRPSQARPAKPYESFPLYAHPSGQWAKTINGRKEYFGRWSDPMAALSRYQREFVQQRQQVGQDAATLGEPQVLIHCDELARGWVCIHGESQPTDPVRLPYLLNDDFCRWLKENPKVKVRTTLPIVANGNTVAIHVFFD